MNNTAMTLMIVALVIIWGGLILSFIHLLNNPDIDMDQIPNE
ncbi:methionine/alanine import family NSS transporter small subunit [Moraxella sp. Tifton1]|uniref:Methionine/alanine import family NSS transporter small subunit n=1 Tax=Moraxella oculi TaxID=2940516 RepID=A0ABW8U3E6_9GAMM|nr:methionine/alanine import family NSS transporter small subunit [Moraxella sp. Tifton1]MCL1622780.1 methionine/alanine import family NSS transporter small subunit [Moraxella sp. Tifton1]